MLCSVPLSRSLFLHAHDWRDDKMFVYSLSIYFLQFTIFVDSRQIDFSSIPPLRNSHKLKLLSTDGSLSVLNIRSSVSTGFPLAFAIFTFYCDSSFNSVRKLVRSIENQKDNKIATRSKL